MQKLILQGSVATQLKCGGIFNNQLTFWLTLRSGCMEQSASCTSTRHVTVCIS